jgi:predicted kinase
MELVLIRGLPGSGKTTMATRDFTVYAHFEADQFFEYADGSYKYDASKLADAHAWCQKTTKHILTMGQSVVVSNTFTQHWEMKPYLDMAKDLNVPVRILVATGNYTSVHGVPEAAIAAMRRRWED